ncbi:MAG: ABC transporter permease [Acidobacteriota bacterium]
MPVPQSTGSVLAENFWVALKALGANKMRSILTTLGIIIGVAAVVAVVSIVQGLNFFIAGELQGVGATYIRVLPFRDDNDPAHAARDVRLTLEDVRAIAERATEVAAVTPILYRPARVRAGSRRFTSYLLGVSEEYEDVLNHTAAKGRFFGPLDVRSRARVCTVGEEIVRRLQLGPEPVGREIEVDGRPCTVIGVMEKKGETFGQNRDEIVFLPYTTALLAYGRDAERAMLVDVKARSPENVDLAKSQIRSVLRANHRLAPDAPDDFKIVAQEEILKTTSGILAVITTVIGAVVGIALVVGGIGIMNVMLVSVTQRTREIGVRKAVGARRRDVMIQFLVEAVTLALVGGVLGVLLGWGLGVLGASLIPGFPPAHVPLWAIVLAFGFSAAVGIFFGIYPAAKASALDPIEALRHE